MPTNDQERIASALELANLMRLFELYRNLFSDSEILQLLKEIKIRTLEMTEQEEHTIHYFNAKKKIQNDPVLKSMSEMITINNRTRVEDFIEELQCLSVEQLISATKVAGNIEFINKFIGIIPFEKIEAVKGYFKHYKPEDNVINFKR